MLRNGGPAGWLGTGPGRPLGGPWEALGGPVGPKSGGLGESNFYGV